MGSKRVTPESAKLTILRRGVGGKDKDTLNRQLLQLREDDRAQALYDEIERPLEE